MTSPASTEERPEQRHRSGRRTPLVVLSAIVALALVAALAWWHRETVAEWLGIADDAQSAGPEVGVNVSEVSDHPDALYGRRVVVSAAVERVVTPHAVLVGDIEPVVGDLVLVVSDVAVGDLASAIQVTGEVRRFDPAALSQDLGIDLGDDLGYDGRAVIVASSITAAPPPTVPGDTEQAGPSGGVERAVSIDDMTDGELQDLIGQQVTVSGEIEKLLAPHAIRFGDAMVLAVGPMDEAPFIEATAVITGEVVTFDLDDAEQRLQLQLGNDLRQFDGEPAIIIEDLELTR